LAISDQRERRDVLKGTIDEFPLIDVLGILQARNKTGRLEIERQAGRGLIYVRLGEPYYAESSLTRSLIGQKLVDIGAITDMQLRKALDRQAESGDRLGQILLTHGVISGEHIAAAVISQIKDALADLLAWEAGEFTWEAGAEVEVEVPLFGATIGSIDEANPLAPHIVPVHSAEADATPEDPARPEAVAEPADFPQGGTTTTGNEVTATPIETSPDAGLESLDHVDSTPEMEDEPEDEDENTNEPEDESQDEPELGPAQEFEDESQDETETEQEAEPVQELEDESQDEPDTEEEPVPVEEFENEAPEETDHEPEPEQEAEPVQEFEDEPVLPSLTIEAGAQPEPEFPPPFNTPRVIRSQPAPELDEEFEAVFEATERVSFDPEPVVEPVVEPAFEAPAFDPPPVSDPVFGADAFKPVVPDNDFDQPAFEPAATSPDPVFDPANFEPVAESPEPVTESSEPVVEAVNENLEPVAESFEPVAETPVASAPEPEFDATAPEFETIPEFETPTPEFESPTANFDAPQPVSEDTANDQVAEAPGPLPDVGQPEPVEVAPEMPVADSMPVTPSPPPPPPDAPAAEATEDAPPTPEEAPAEDQVAPSNGTAAESLKDIKLDRSSLVRELSDLLR
jgi:Domain of unknown function (DUF4388)